MCVSFFIISASLSPIRFLGVPCYFVATYAGRLVDNQYCLELCEQLGTTTSVSSEAARQRKVSLSDHGTAFS